MARSLARIRMARRSDGPLLLTAAIAALILLGSTTAFATTRGTMLARAQAWIDVPVRYSQTKYFGGYRTDCSGFTSMTWRLRSGGHPLSLSTRTLHSVSTTVAPDAMLPGDAMIKYGYHARVFVGWYDAAHTMYVTYEQTGPTTRSSVKSLSADLAYGYVPYRYVHISADPPRWNSIVNPSFDVWVSGAPVWWQASGGSASAVCTRSVAVTKAGHNALGLLNLSGRSRDVVDVSQTASVTAGTPYTTSVWAYTEDAPGGVVLRLRFLDASGTVLSTVSTTGASFNIDTTAMACMSLTATAPADATSATVSVRLAGGTDASGTVGTAAVFDEFRLFDATPVLSSLTASLPTATRKHALTIRGQVTAPIAYGSVRIYMQRPDRRSPIAIADKRLVGGGWSLPFTPGLRGTYRFTVKYLGYGPWGPADSRVLALRVK